MKSLSATNTTLSDAPVIDIVRLCKIEFSGLTLYLCDRVWGGAGSECVFDSEIWEPLIFEISTIETGSVEALNYGLTPGSAEITIDNNTSIGGKNRFTELSQTYDFHYADITISDYFVGSDAEIDVFKGQIENIRNMTSERITLVCSSYEIDLANKFPVTILNTDDYSGADPDDVGKMFPIVYGAAKKVPALAIDAGGKSTIVEDMTDSAPGNSGTLEITNGAVYPSGAFTFQVDSEQIQIASRAGNVLTLAAAAARAFGGTTAVAHDSGAPCAEIQTNYYYLVAGHPVKMIGDIYVDNVRVDSGYTAYTGQAGDNDPSGLYDGLAIINFTTLPVFSKQVNLEGDNGTLDVDDSALDNTDTIAVSTGSHSHGSYNYLVVNAQGVKTDSDVGTAEDAVGSSMGDYAYFDDSTDYGEWEFNTTIDQAGDPDSIKIGLWLKNRSSNTTTLTFGFKDSGGTVLTSFTTTPTGGNADDQYSGSWVDVSAKTWAQISGGYFYIDVVSWNTSQVDIYYMWLEIRYTPEASAATGVAKSGSVAQVRGTVLTGAVAITGNSTAETVIGNRIAADTWGYQDDGAGTYTGTATKLIERPDHILNHMLVSLGGLTAAQLDIAGTYATSGAEYFNEKFNQAPVLLQRPNFMDLIERIALQAKSMQFWESGVHHLIYLEDNPTTDKTIDATRIDLQQIWIQYTDRIEIKNTFSARYARDWSGYSDAIGYSAEEIADRAVVIESNASSVSDYGTLEADTLSFPYVTTADHAQKLLEWKSRELSFPRLIVEFSGSFYLTDVEKGDILEFTEGDLLGTVTTGALLKEDGDALLKEDGDGILLESTEYKTYLYNAFAGLITLDKDQFRVIDVSRGVNEIIIRAIALTAKRKE